MSDPVRQAATELPVEGYPASAEAVAAWFVRRWGRWPGAPELGAILNAMAARDTTPPIERGVDGTLPPGVTPRRDGD